MSVPDESSSTVDSGSCYSVFNFMCMFCRSLFVLLYCFFWPLCCLFFFLYTDYDYPFGIFKLFSVGFVFLDLQFYVYVLQIVVCPFVLFLLAIMLSVLRFMFLINTTGATSGAATAYSSGAPGFLWASYYSIFSFMCMFCRLLFVLLSFCLLAIVLSILRFTFLIFQTLLITETCTKLEI